MRSLTNRLRLSWLTIVALVAFGMVGLIRPTDVNLVDLEFAHDADRFKQALLRSGEMDLAFETVALVRAQLAADMVFLVAYGLLLRTSVRLLRSTPFARLAAHAAVVVMFADAVENVSALAVLRTLGEETMRAPGWWFTVMNAASGTKWAVAGATIVCLAAGWWREARTLAGWRRRVARVIAAVFAGGGVSSVGVVAGLAIGLPGSVPALALALPAVGFLLQFRLLDVIGLMFRFVSLGRVPFSVLLIVAAFGPIALGPAVGLLGGILVAANFTGVFVTTLAAIAVLSACATQINIVRAHGWQRTMDDTLRVLDHQVLGTGTFWAGIVAVASLVFCLGLASPALSVWVILAGAILGTGVGFGLVLGIEFIAARFVDLAPDAPLPEFSFPFRSVPALRAQLNAKVLASAPSFKKRFDGSFLARLFGKTSGYVEELKGGRLRILPAHTFAAIQFAVTTVLFWAALYAKSLPPARALFSLSAARTDEAFLVPTVTSIVLLLLLSGWAFGAVAFFIDRYRTPLFTIALGVTLTTGSWIYTDHLVAIADGRGTYQLATPGQVLSAFGSRPLVVAAAGGGIQAGAWTARVLQGVDEHLGGTLRQRVALVSSVSGGSMGALYYGAYDGSPDLTLATQQALKPSLDEIATALVGRDVFRVIGLSFRRDRGAALEESWEERLPEAQRDTATLRKWAEKVRGYASDQAASRPFPAFLFNSTIVESGQPLAFATTQVPTRQYRLQFDVSARQYPVVESANRVFRFASADDGPARDVGLKAVTAARLSAAFPYVSPAATLDIPAAEPFHLVDGGYYDVYGLVALAQWLDDALEEHAREHARTPTEIGVVIARGLASSDSALLTRLRSDDPVVTSLDGGIRPRGWSWQLTAPPSTALHARTFGQWAGSVQVLTLLIDKWEKRGVRIVPYVFDYPGTDRTPVCQAAPLSWKLTTPQQKCIEAAWRTFKDDHASALWKLH